MNEYIKTALELARTTKYYGPLERCLRDFVAEADLYNAEGEPLMVELDRAIEHGYVDLLSSLLLCTKFATELDKGGVSPLHFAAYYGDMEAVKTLIELGRTSKQSPIKRKVCFTQRAPGGTKKW
jgi:ankyrin repeat protein